MPLDLSYEAEFDGHTVSTDRSRIDLKVVSDFLLDSYWGKDHDLEYVTRLMEHSLPFGLFDSDGRMVGYCRVVSDYTKFAYLSDFFVLEDLQGKGIGGKFLKIVHGHPELKDVNYWYLRTKDAQRFYGKHGWAPIKKPHTSMEKRRPKKEDLQQTELSPCD